MQCMWWTALKETDLEKETADEGTVLQVMKPYLLEVVENFLAVAGVYSGSRKDVQSGNLQVLTTSFAKPNQAGTKSNVVRQQLWPGLCHRPSFLQSA